MFNGWHVEDYSKVIVIGDVHGYYATLLNLLDKLTKEYPDHKIIFLGDLIDKGKRSRDVVGLIKENHFSILGNHDWHMGLERNWRNWRPYESLWVLNNGIATTVRSYGAKRKIRYSQDHRARFYQDALWLRTLPLVLELPNVELFGKKVVLSHAPLTNSVELMGGLDNYKKTIDKPMDDLWGSCNALGAYVNYKELDSYTKEHIAISENVYFHNFSEVEELKPISGVHNIFGHVHRDNVAQNENYTSMDTTVYKPNKLSALVLPENKIVDTPTVEDKWQFKT